MLTTINFVIRVTSKTLGTQVSLLLSWHWVCSMCRLWCPVSHAKSVTYTLPTLAGAGHQWTTPVNKRHLLVAISVGTLRPLVAITSRCGEGITLFWGVCYVTLMTNNFIIRVTSMPLGTQVHLLLSWHWVCSIRRLWCPVSHANSVTSLFRGVC